MDSSKLCQYPYYPFGMQMPDRSYSASASGYRLRRQGKKLKSVKYIERPFISIPKG
jgi:hypothetical protein